jgi:beta-lysine 5,6-aminomutase alpha subunit
MKLDLDKGLVDSCQNAAIRIVSDVMAEIDDKTTVSVERATARLYGMTGADEGVPFVNQLVDGRGHDDLGRGIARRMHGDPIPVLAEKLTKRQEMREQFDAARSYSASPTLRYVLTATGDVDEDVTHALAVAEAGGDIIAVIRSTAQSLLDFVPEGATHEGFGGTFATQENFRIMREALDEWSIDNGRYVRLSSFCSGLCMPEIAAIGAMEGLDNLVNDCMYGILYRDLNPVRTMIDQRFSRMINGWAGIVINTGEDNYPRTADTMDCAPSVTASWFINYFMAKACQVPDRQIGLGLAFEIDPALPNSLAYEIAHSQLLRDLFPDCPTKYMPPTSHMNGNLWRTHAVDAMFNLVTELTGHGIQTIGVPTEGIFTPHIHDRVLGMEAVNYAALAARSLGDEIEFAKGGLIRTRAASILSNAHDMLERIAEEGFFTAIEQGTFGDVKRPKDKGRGADGIVQKAPDYSNPILDAISA